MLKTVLVSFFAVSVLAASAAIGDTVTARYSTHGEFVTISGHGNGTASELFTIMEHAGVHVRRFPEADELNGSLLTALAQGWTGTNYSVAFQINSASTSKLTPHDVTFGGSEVLLSGQVAQELYGYMDLAGLQKRLAVDGNVILGHDLNCSVFYVGGAHFSCEISVK